ncbi:MAG: glycosyl hydrolase [Porcipelethomonas sp.]
MKKTAAISAALLAASVLTASLSSSALTVFSAEKSASEAEICYEFENGKTEGGKIYTEGWKGNTEEDGSGEDYDLTNASNGGFSFLDQKGTSISVEVDVEEAGLYELTVCYCEPSDPNKKVQYLNINGVNQGEISFPHNLTFEETSGGIVMLEKGVNVIEFKAYWGYTYFDYLTVKPADESLNTLSPDRQLSNPNASDSAKRLYNYLCDQYGNHILSGQQEYCGSHNYNLYADPGNYIKDNEQEFEYIKEKTGKMCAVRGIDFLNYRSNASWDDNAAERTIQWVNEYKGIATVVWHWSVPSEEGSTDCNFYVESASDKYTTFSISKALEEGTWENEVLMADIAEIAKQLTKLKEADVPVLWRPLHEAEGGWFWWGAEGPENCKKLYRLLYDQLTNVYGLDNLIWVWTGYSFSTSADWYPGDDVVDILGYDKYNAVDGMPNLSSISSTFYSLVKSTDGKKMVAMTENDSIPSLENLLNDKAAWLYFCPWYMNYLTSEQNNPVDNLNEIYNSEYCITLDELPDLKSYPMAEETEVIKGDVNLDGKVDAADAVLLIKYLTAQTNLSAKQGEAASLTDDNKLNVFDLLALKKTLLKGE